MRFWKGEITMATVVIQKRKGIRGVTYAILYAHPLTGEKKYYKTCKKYKEARWEANELRAILDAGKMPDKKKAKLDPLTFSQVADSLKKEWQLQIKRRELSEKTVHDYCIWLGVLERTFGRSLLSQIRREDIVDFRDAEIQRNSVVSANKYLNIIKKIFSHGLDLNAVTESPAENIALLSEKEHERKKFILPSDIDRLIEAAQKTRAKYYLPAAIYLGAEHGASRQEILSLRWPHIDFEYAGRGIIYLYRTKNKNERTEYLMPRTKQALLSWRNHQEWMRHRKKIDYNGSDLVFCKLNGDPIKRFHKAWKETCKIAGISNFRFHDLRHTFCSNLILTGAGLKDVKEMIGHKDISMTDRYSHLSLDRKLFLQEKLAEHYLNRIHLKEPSQAQ